VMNSGSAETHRPDSCLFLLRRGSTTLFLLSFGCHNISKLYPSIKATDIPFAEALM
jgi:hypothetical protein